MPGTSKKDKKRTGDKMDSGGSRFDVDALPAVREVDIGDRWRGCGAYKRPDRRWSMRSETLKNEEGLPASGPRRVSTYPFLSYPEGFGDEKRDASEARACPSIVCEPDILPSPSDVSSDECNKQRTIRPWESGDPYQNSPQRGDHWYQCHVLTAKHDADMCMVWKAEVDNLLIFAGLFSAAVTAFTIESYKWLQPDSNVYGNQVLTLIYEQLNSSSISLVPPGQKPENSVVRINIFWFLSLALGLTTVLIGIISAQWLREYQRDVSLSPKDKLALRQMRHEGLLFWQVPRIIAMLPMFLQTAFILFLVGIVELLWTLNSTVAIPVTVVIGSVFLSLLLTVILPTAQWLFPGDKYLRVPQCPFKSPQSLAVLRFTVASLRCISSRFWVSLEQSSPTSRIFTASYKWTWTDFDLRWRAIRDADILAWGSPIDEKDSDDIKKSLTWFVATFPGTAETITLALNCLRELPLVVAQKVVHDSCSPVDPQTSEEFNAILKGTPSPSEAVQRDILDIAFLQPYQQIRGYPSLQDCYWESQIRLMNALPGRLHGLSTPHFKAEDLSEEVQIQLIAALKTIVQENRATQADIQNMWSLLRLNLSPEQHNAYLSTESAFDLFSDLHQWLNEPGELDRRSRVKLSMDGIRQVVYPGFYKVWNKSPGYKNIEAFIYKLDELLQDMGDLASALEVEENPRPSVVKHIWKEYSRWVFSNPSQVKGA